MQRRKLFQRVVLFGAVLALGTWGLRSETVGEKVCAEVRAQAPRVPGLSIHIGHCQLEPWELAVELRDVAVAYQGEVGVDVKAERAALQLQLLRGLLDRSLGRVELVRPRVDLDLSRLMEKPATATPPGSCTLNELVREIPLGNVVISEATAHVGLPASRSIDLRNLDLTERSHHGVASVRLSEQGGNLAYGNGELPLDKVTLSASLDTTENTVELSRLEVAAGQVSALAHGSARDLCDPDIQLEASVGVPVDLLSALINSPSFAAKGYVTANLRANGRLDLDRLNAHADLELNDLEMAIMGQHLDPQDFTASADLRNRHLELGQFYWPLGNGYARISGGMDLRDNFPFTASVEGKSIPFGELFNHLPIKHPWVDSLVNVKAKQVGHLFPSVLFSGPVSADFTDFHVRTRAWDAPAEKGDEVFGFKHEHVDAMFELDKAQDRIHLTKVHLSGPTADLEAEGTLSLDTQKGMDLTIDLKSLDLAEVGGAIAGLPWKGTASAHARLTGPYGPPTVDAQLAIQDFTMVMVHLGDTKGRLRFDPSMVMRFEDVVAVKNGHTSYGGDGLLDFSHPGGPIGGGDVRIANGRIEDLLEVLKDVHWSFEMLNGQMTGLVSGSIHLKPSPILAPTSDFDLRLSQLTLYQRPLGATEFQMHTEAGDSITVAPMTVDGTLGQMTFSGWQRVGGELSYVLGLKGVQMPVASAPELIGWDMTGTLEGTLAITGPSAQPRIRGDVFGTGLSVFGLPLGYGHVQVHGEGPSMAITGSVGNDVSMDLRMRWEGDLPMKAHFGFQIADLFPYVPTTPAWNDIAGTVRGTLDVEGKMKDSSSYHGRFDFPLVRVSKGDYIEENHGPVKLAFHGDVFEIQSFAFQGHRENDREANTQFSLSGTRSGEDDRLALRFDGSLDGRIIEAVYPLLENTSGAIAVNGRVTGTQAKPELVGSLELEHGHLKVRDQDITASDLHGRVVFSQASVQIPEGIDGTINKGRARLTGDIALKGSSPSSYDLQLSLDDARFTFSDWPAVTVRGEIAYAGKASDPYVSGDLDVHNFDYEKKVTLPSLLEGMRNRKLEAQAFVRAEPLWRYNGLTIDLAQESDDRVLINTNLLKVSLKGRLAVLGDNTRPLLRGQVEALPGGRAFWADNTYALTDLTLGFKEENGLVPEFVAHARSHIREYEVIAHAHGILDGDNNHYAIDLDSTPHLSEADLLTLTSLGFTSQDRGGVNAQSAGIAGAAINGIEGLAGLDTIAAKFVPQDGTLVSDPSFKLTTTYSLHAGSMEPTAQFEGKILDKALQGRLRIRVEQQAGTSNATKAQLMYRLNDWAGFKALYDGDNSDQYTFPDVGADVQFHTIVK